MVGELANFLRRFWLRESRASTFTHTTQIFGDENFTRVEFRASTLVPVLATRLLLAPGLVGLAAIRRRFKE
jgi:hypothetical protein